MHMEGYARTDFSALFEDDDADFAALFLLELL